MLFRSLQCLPSTDPIGHQRRTIEFCWHGNRSTAVPNERARFAGEESPYSPEAAESANKDNVVIGEPRDNKQKDKVLAREIVLSRQPDGKETIKITIGNPALGGQRQERRGSPPRFIKPNSPEVGRWKTNRSPPRPRREKPTYDMLFSKYSRQKAGFNSNRPYYRKRPRSHS